MSNALGWLLSLGPTNPIAVRLVQRASARTKHLTLRAAFLGAMIVVLLWALVTNTRGDEMSFRDLAAVGARSFELAAYVQVAMICVLAPVFMAGAIAREADPRTWDILLTTPLTPAQIVLGNLLGRLFFIFALLLASVPLLAVTQYFGGVPGTSILASYAIAAGAALFVGSAAVGLSVSRVVGRRAVFAFYVSIVLFLACTFAGDAVLRARGLGAQGTTGVTVLTGLNPFLALRSVMDASGYPAAAPGTTVAGWGIGAWLLERPVAAFVAMSAAFSLVLVVLSVATVRLGGIAGVGGVAQGDGDDEPVTAPGTTAAGGGAGRGAGPMWLSRLLGLGVRGRRRARPVRGNPIAWRESVARNATLGRIVSRWSFIGAGLVAGAAVVLLLHTGRLSPEDFRAVLAAVVLGESAVIVLVAVNMAASSIAREREDGTLDLLLITPLSVGSYLGGKLRGMVAYLLPMLAVPLATLAAAGLYAGVIRGPETAPGASASSGPLGAAFVITSGPAVVANGGAPISGVAPLVLPEAALVAALALVPFVALAVMVGVSYSLRARGTLGAVAATLGTLALTLGLAGVCGFKAAADLRTLGPVLGGLTPGATLWSCIYPEKAMLATVAGSSLNGARLMLGVGAFIGALATAGAIYGLHSAAARGFDATVRRLAGLK